MKQSPLERGSIFALLGLGGICLLGYPWGSGAASERPEKATGKAKEAITYAKQVSRIIQDKCQSCHHPGTAAPFSLLTYKDAVHWSETIREVVSEKRMPPWHADPRYGSFSNDRRLTAEELDTLLAWLDGGTPLGEEKDLPPARKYEEGWVIGKPDVVFELPAEQ